MAYLRELQKRHKITASEMARLSQVFADVLQQPTLAFTQQAAWAWVNGTRTPRPEHRKSLAMIFQVPLEDLNRVMDGSAQIPRPIVRPVTVYVRGDDREFDYRLTVKTSIDFGRPAIYKGWGEIFQPPPVRLQRHFKRLTHTLFGWIPDRSVSPMVRYPRSLAPLSEDRAALGNENTVDKHVWFVYRPDGMLDFGIAFQEGRWLHLTKPNQPDEPVQKYPLSRVDLVGYVAGRVLFHLDLL